MFIHVADDSATPTRKRRKTKPEAMTKTTDLTVQFEITENDLEAIRRGEMLNDCHINSASALIKEAFPKIKGLQNTLNEMVLSLLVMEASRSYIAEATQSTG